ncbi:MAG TPA: glycosyltransferase family 1 protein [Flavisolibacter sp.]|jgi:glycosyltransferase involved in cell wall biosynthesis|nr:glycosyltransferase family 1 protein [Flavisolibacter sp.]
MKVAFDIKNLWLYGKGIGAFTLNLLQDIATNPPAFDGYVQLYSPSFEPASLNFVQSQPLFQKVTTRLIDKKSRLDKVRYDQVSFLSSLQKQKPDLLFSPYFDIPLFWNKPTITTIHDLSIYEGKGSYGKGFYTYYNLLIKKAVRQSSFIITVSAHSKRKLMETFHIPDEKIKIIYNKVQPSFLVKSAEADKEKLSRVKATYQLPDEFILYTGGLEKRKNIGLLVQGITNAKKKCAAIPKLVITGVGKDNIPPAFRNWLQQENVILLDYLPYESLAGVYKLASLIVNTSGDEGFGIPVLEALTMQKPILCSDIPVYQEVGQEYAFYFRNNDSSSFEQQLIQYFQGKLKLPNPEAMKIRADFFNQKNYSHTFFQLVTHSL